MKKIISLLLVFLLAVMLFSTAVFAQDSVQTNDKKATIEIGSAVFEKSDEDIVASVPIKFEGELTLTALQLQVSTEAGVEFVKFTEGDALKGVIPPKTGVTPVVVIFLDTTLKGVPVNSGTLATLDFKFPVSRAKEYKLLLTLEAAIDDKNIQINDSIILKDGSVVIGADEIQSEQPEEIMTSEERKSDTVCMKIGKSTAIAYGKKTSIDVNDAKVVPYISNDRTMIPLRFVAETLGADILWEEGWDGCIVKKDDKEIKFTFGSSAFLVNGEEVTFDAPIEMLNDRTMVPVRFFSEQFGCDVYWEPINSLVVLSPVDNPWVAERKSEIRAINEMLISIYGIL